MTRLKKSVQYNLKQYVITLQVVFVPLHCTICAPKDLLKWLIIKVGGLNNAGSTFVVVLSNYELGQYKHIHKVFVGDSITRCNVWFLFLLLINI